KTHNSRNSCMLGHAEAPATTSTHLAVPAALLRRQLGLAFLAFILVGANDGALGVLLPSMRAHYGIDKGTVGLLFLAGTTGYLHAFYGVGALLGPLLASAILAVGWGWNSVYFVWVGLSVVLAAGFVALFAGRGNLVHHERAMEGGSGNVLAAALRLRIVWLTA